MGESIKSPGKLFLLVITLLAYTALSLIVLLGISPALISARSDILVLAGFMVPAVWLTASLCIASHFFNKRRKSAAHTTTEKQP